MVSFDHKCLCATINLFKGAYEIGYSQYLIDYNGAHEVASLSTLSSHLQNVKHFIVV